MPPTPFALALRGARQKAGLSQAALGKRAGLTAPYISLLESGRRRPPSPSQVERLARALGLEPGAWLEQAALERSPAAVQRRIEGLDRERGRVTRARDRILTTSLFRVSRMPGLLAALGESPEETGSFGHLLVTLAGRMRGMRSAREAEARSAEILARVSARERDRLIEALPDVLAVAPVLPPPPATAGAPPSAPGAVPLEVRGGLAPDAPTQDTLHVDARWAMPGGFAWKLESDEGWPRLGAGDVLIVDPTATAREGDLVALHDGGRDLVRTLKRRGEREVLLEALRADVAPLRLPPEAFRPVGVITHVLRSVR